MTLEEIKCAVDSGLQVCWKNPMYSVKKSGVQYDVVCSFNGDCTGLTWTDGITMDYKPQDFFILVSHQA